MANYICYLILIGIQLPFFYKKDELGNWYLKNKAYLALCCVEMIFLAGLRGYTVGADTATYLFALNYYQGIPFADIVAGKYMPPMDFEWGYFLFTEICRTMGMNETVYLFVIACLIFLYFVLFQSILICLSSAFYATLRLACFPIALEFSGR